MTLNGLTEHLELLTTTHTTRSSSGRGRGSKLELTGIKKLRELILELAVQGKLVPQNPDDEPASVLLERIAAEKARLVKEKKIKKRKPLPPIAENEQPFGLPAGWQFVQLADVALVDMGNSPPSNTYNDTGNGAPLINGPVEFSKGHFGKTLKVKYTITPNIMCEEGDILVCVRGATTGRTNIAAFNACIGRGVARVKGLASQDFINLLMWKNQYSLLSKGTGTTFPSISYVDLAGHTFLFPPEAEQHRIVSKVNELMTLCDQLEQDETDSIAVHQALVDAMLTTLTDSKNAKELAENWSLMAQHFDTLFTTDHSIEQLKQTILQLAVMGRLVPQNDSDEPASVLLERIATEKARLVKEKKIKKQKPLPAITDVDMPFQLPSGWSWARLEDVVDIHSGITKGRKLVDRERVSVPYLRVANVQRAHLVLDEIKEVEIPVEEQEKYQIKARDLLITEGGDWDKVGRTAIWSDELPYMAHQNHVFKARIFLAEQSELWLERYLNGPVARQYFAKSSKQTTNLASINKTQLRGCPIAIPPANEKDRIVARVNELMNLCDALQQQVQQAQTTQYQLATAIVEEAIG